MIYFNVNNMNFNKLIWLIKKYVKGKGHSDKLRWFGNEIMLWLVLILITKKAFAIRSLTWLAAVELS